MMKSVAALPLGRPAATGRRVRCTGQVPRPRRPDVELSTIVPGSDEDGQRPGPRHRGRPDWCRRARSRACETRPATPVVREHLRYRVPSSERVASTVSGGNAKRFANVSCLTLPPSRLPFVSGHVRPLRKRLYVLRCLPVPHVGGPFKDGPQPDRPSCSSDAKTDA